MLNIRHQFKIPSLGITATRLSQLPFGRQIEYLQKIKRWQETATIGHVSQKSRTTAVAVREFCKLNNVAEYYFADTSGANYRDDVLTIAYKCKPVSATVIVHNAELGTSMEYQFTDCD